MKKNTFVNCNVDDLHEAQLDILRELKRVCQKNNLRYYLAFGTCLGAVRHKGFIPWDSDIDVFMFIEDVDKLIALQKDFKKGYFVQSVKTDPEYDSTSVRIRNSNTTFIIEEEGIERDINHGVWIDIYPLYYCPKSDLKKKIYILLSFFNRLLIANRVPKNHGKYVKIVSKLILTVIPDPVKKLISNKINKCLRKNKNTKEVFHFFSGRLRLKNVDISKAAWFKEPSEMEFEGEMFSGPTCPDAFLKLTYGDYMKLPPKEEQVIKFEGAFIDTNNSYKIYKGKQYCIKKRKA